MPSKDTHDRRPDSDDPITSGVAITPSDSADLDNVSRSIYVGTAGSLKVTLRDMVDGSFITLPNLAAGVVHPLRAKRIWAASTAVNIHALW